MGGWLWLESFQRDSKVFHRHPYGHEEAVPDLAKLCPSTALVLRSG
jgi:hypothetical protein